MESVCIPCGPVSVGVIGSKAVKIGAPDSVTVKAMAEIPGMAQTAGDTMKTTSIQYMLQLLGGGC